MAVYYNEIDPFCCDWLRQLIKRGLIPDGEIDNRSIEDVRPDDLKGFSQCHFFAGIGGWAYALRQSGWPDNRPVWTGSCPCQPFSTAGKRAGTSDERHLWPAFFWLISQCKPDVIIGEQVASKDALAWWDIVHTDLEGAGYACGVCDTCAAGFGAPHIRQRLYWVAHSAEFRCGGNPTETTVQRQCAEREGQHTQPEYVRELSQGLEGRCGAGRVDNAQVNRVEDRPAGAGIPGQADGSRVYGLGCASPLPGIMGDTERQGLEGYARHDGADSGEDSVGSVAEAGEFGRLVQSDNCGWSGGLFPQAVGSNGKAGQSATDGGVGVTGAMPTNGFWANPDWLWCRDKKWRPVKPGSSPLVDGLPAGMGSRRDVRAIRQRLKGYGNAIVIPQAVEFIKAVTEELCSK